MAGRFPPIATRSLSAGSRPSSRLLDEALPFVKDHGFALEAFTAAGIPSRSIKALFPSHGPFSNYQDGPAGALFLHWSQRQNERGFRDGHGNVNGALTRRIRYNVDIMPHLRRYLTHQHAPTDSLILNLLARPTNTLHRAMHTPYRQHILQVADECCWNMFPDVQGELWYSKRMTIAGAYSAAEIYQLSDHSPDFRATDQVLEKALAKTKTFTNGIQETATFANYVGTSWHSILRNKHL